MKKFFSGYLGPKIGFSCKRYRLISGNQVYYIYIKNISRNRQHQKLYPGNACAKSMLAGAAGDGAWNLVIEGRSLQKDAVLQYRGKMRVKINTNKMPQKMS